MTARRRPARASPPRSAARRSSRSRSTVRARRLPGHLDRDDRAEAGISQPYLFRLFRTKRDLFLACYDVSHERILETFAAGRGVAARARRSPRWARPTSSLLRDTLPAPVPDAGLRRLLGPGHPGARARRATAIIVDEVTRLSGAAPEEVWQFFSHGMLLNVIASLDLPAIADASGVGRVVVRAGRPDPQLRAELRAGVTGAPAPHVRRRHRAGARGPAALAGVGAGALVRRRAAPNGGFLAAVAARAAESATGRPLRSLTLHFLAAPAVGPLDVAAAARARGPALHRRLAADRAGRRADDARPRDARRAAGRRRRRGTRRPCPTRRPPPSSSRVALERAGRPGVLAQLRHAVGARRAPGDGAPETGGWLRAARAARARRPARRRDDRRLGARRVRGARRASSPRRRSTSRSTSAARCRPPGWRRTTTCSAGSQPARGRPACGRRTASCGRPAAS